jgi:formamidopyrimidine-DNA glycosylase
VIYKSTKKRTPGLNDEGTDWPPQYWKAAIAFEDGSEWAFCDSRRLGRIKLIDGDIKQVPPLSLLGADPIHAMPSTEVLAEKLGARTAPIKAHLLDQNATFAGLGNWLVDEILFQALIHPAQPCCSLTPEQIQSLHSAITDVCQTAVAVDADSHQFPSHWLFKHRWSKGKKGVTPSFVHQNGQTVTIKFETVGGRTSAITSVQKLVKTDIKSPTKRKKKTVEVEVEEEEDGSAVVVLPGLEIIETVKGEHVADEPMVRRFPCSAILVD